MKLFIILYFLTHTIVFISLFLSEKLREEVASKCVEIWKQRELNLDKYKTNCILNLILFSIITIASIVLL